MTRGIGVQIQHACYYLFHLKLKRIMRILKYNITQSRSHMLPVGTRILTSQAQHGQIVVWALVNENISELVEYNFSIVPTGIELDNDMKLFTYINTIQQFDGCLIWHIFVDKV